MGRENAARLYLIGSPFVRLGDERLALPNRKLLALMAVLALDGPTERARLAELLWSGADMDSRGRLRRELYRLRGTPGATLILEEDQVLRLGNVSSDLADFRLALEKQDWAAAENLGRGTLLEGLVFDLPEFDDWLEFHRVEFDESYRSVLLQSALDLEARGLTREALEVFERLWRLDSLNEEAVRGAMRVLEIIGDSTRMLAVYKQFSDQLEFELGIKPSLDTQNLAAKARGERLELAPVISSLQQKAPKPFRSDSPLFGREQAWRQLEAAWLAGKTIFICGEPGIGKSSLMLEFAISKTMPHEQVLAVHRHADSQIAFSGLARLLRALQNNQTADKLPTWARSELARLLPELGEPSASSSDGQTRLLAAVAEFTNVFGSDVQLLLRDDIQFMDAATWDLNLKLDHSVSTIMTYRKNEISEKIQTDINAMLEAGQAVLIELNGLELNAVQELVEQNLKTITSENLENLSARLHAYTAGNPLFVLETLKAIQESGQSFLPDTQLPHANKVREVIALRLERLSKPAKDLVRVAAILVEDFSLEFAAQVLGGDALQFSDAIFELEDAGIMTDGRFMHDALYETALERIPKPARVLLHNRALVILESQPQVRGTANVFLRHAMAAQNPLKILEWSVLAAKEATERFAYTEALTHYDKALLLETDPRKSFELYAEQSRIHRTQGHRKAWEETVEGMLWQAAQTKDPTFEARAALAELDLLLERGDFRDAFEHAMRLLERPNLNPSQRGLTLLNAGQALIYLKRFSEVEHYFLEAELLIPIEDHALVARLQAELRNAAERRNDLTEARLRNALVLEACRRSGSRSGEISARLTAGSLAEVMGDFDAALLNYQVATERAFELGDLSLQRYAAYAQADFYLKQLKPETAKPHVARGLEISINPPDMMYEGIFHERQAYLYGFDGQLNLMLEAGKRALNCYKRLGFASYQTEQFEWLAHRLIEMGQFEAALEHIEQGLKLAEQEQLEDQIECFILARARLNLVMGQSSEAFELLKPIMLEPEKLVSSNAFPSHVVLGQVCFEQGLFLEAAKILSIQESLATHEAFRFAALLKVQIVLGTIQEADLTAAEKLVIKQLPPSNALELQISLAHVYSFQKLHENAKSMMALALKNQEVLTSSLSLDQKKTFLERIRTL